LNVKIARSWRGIVTFIATLLADLLRRHSSAPPKALRFCAISPLFDNAPFAVCGMPEPDGRASLRAQNAEGALAMKAEAVMHSA
jgi:3-methylfumaryl-CoA hydratase